MSKITMRYAWYPIKLGNKWHWLTKIFKQDNLYFGWYGYEYWEYSKTPSKHSIFNRT